MLNKILAFGMLLFFASSAYAQEQLNIIPYYPAPYVSYNQSSAANNTFLTMPYGEVGIGRTSSEASLEDISKDPASIYSYSYKIPENTSVFFMKKGSEKPSYEIKKDNLSLKFTLDENAKVFKAEGDTVEYSVTIQGIPMILRHTASPTGVKEEFIMDKKPDSSWFIVHGSQANNDAQTNQLTIPFAVESKGLQVKDDGQGRYTFTDSQGQTLWQIQPPTLKDAKGKEGEIKGTLSPVTSAFFPVILNPKGEGSPANAGKSETSSEILRSAQNDKNSPQNDKNKNQNDTYTLSLPASYLLQASYPVVIDPTVIINTSSTTRATQSSTMRHIVRTSDGTLHSFIQIGTQTATCVVGGSKSGLLWFNSTDSGATWNCQNQLSSNTNVYADARVDSSDNIYAVYSYATTDASASYNVYYAQLTKGTGSTWTLNASQTVLTSTSSIGYSYSVLELEGTTRIWLATRYYDGTNYQVSVYYSDGLSTAPLWTQSVATLDTADTSSNYHYPAIVRFGTKIGIMYWNAGGAGAFIKWRYRADSDGLTSWVVESNTFNANTPVFPQLSVVADNSGKIYAAVSLWTGGVSFAYYNGSNWSSPVTFSTGMIQAFASVSTDNTNVWVFYGDTAGLSFSFSGPSKLVYKKGVSPFAAANFDTNATAVVSYHGIFDKVWTYISSSYTDVTTAAGDTTTADVTMPSASGDIIYFGKNTTFDAISDTLSTNGVGGTVVWEYWNGSIWTTLTFTASSKTDFTGTGSGAFTPPVDWATTTVNSEATAYYYIRARLTGSFTTAPVATQFDDIPAINWANVTPTVASNTIHAIWTENAASPTKVRYAPISITFTTLRNCVIRNAKIQ